MKKTSEIYEHEDTGITFKVYFRKDPFDESVTKTLDIQNHSGKFDFIFKNSNIDTTLKVAKALVEIAEFVQKL